MKQLIGLGVILLLSIACSEVEPEYDLTSTVTLSKNQEFTEVLSTGMSIEGGYSIVKQATNHSISEIRFVSSPSFETSVQFVYKPQQDFTGNDFVVIKNCISAGGSGCNNTEYYKYKFTVK